MQAEECLAAAAAAEPVDAGTARLWQEEAGRLSQEAGELLLHAGRRYRAVLEADPTQARAFVQWGRALCLRAELARAAGEARAAADLFATASDKFDGALDIEPQHQQATRLAGLALLDAAVCTADAAAADAAAAGGDMGWEGRGRALQMLKTVQGYLGTALQADARDEEVGARLEECQRMIAMLEGGQAAVETAQAAAPRIDYNSDV